MSKLKKRFRNQYNLSLLWICSFMLIISIDLLEFIIVRDEKVYSLILILILVINLLSGFALIAKYMKTYSKDGSIYKQSLTCGFAIALFIIIIFGRMFTENRLSKLENYDTKAYRQINTHLFLYYFVFILFSCTQEKERAGFLWIIHFNSNCLIGFE
ncbi:unnamed protein product [Brachionus calyciflorus]|uniref:Uncharacterized protein n=1 Tax=Brachionus calyciflorus TaxID=104777 RepID=A0A813Y5C6_9BILA|nr:unnamed protein product [Brachionus calyciflorus]